MVLVYILIAVLAGFLVDRLLLWAEKQGYVYWRKSPRPRVNGGAFLGAMFNSFKPSAHYTVQEQQHQKMKIQEQHNSDLNAENS